MDVRKGPLRPPLVLSRKAVIDSSGGEIDFSQIWPLSDAARARVRAESRANPTTLPWKQPTNCACPASSRRSPLNKCDGMARCWASQGGFVPYKDLFECGGYHMCRFCHWIAHKLAEAAGE